MSSELPVVSGDSQVEVKSGNEPEPETGSHPESELLPSAGSSRVVVATLRRYLPPTLGLALILAVWQVGLTLLDTPVYLVPKPSDVIEAITDNRAQLLQASFRTMMASAIGLFLAIVLGMAGAVVLGLSPLLERSLFPYAVVLQTTPIVAFAPLIVIWIGPGMNSIIVVALIISFFPMLSNTLAGLNSVDPEVRNLFRMYGASKAETMRKLRIPGAMPYIMAGVRISAGLAVIGAIVGEFVAGIGGGRGGLGFVVQVSSKQLNTPYLVAGALAGALVGITYHGAARFATKRTLRWHESTLSPQ